MKGTAVRTSIYQITTCGTMDSAKMAALAGDGVAPTLVGRWQRSWGRSAVSGAALDDEPGLRGWILSHAKPALSVGTSFVRQTVKNKMPPVLKKVTCHKYVGTHDARAQRAQAASAAACSCSLIMRPEH